MFKILEDFEPEIKVLIYNGEVVGVTYAGTLLAYSEEECQQRAAVIVRNTYEEGNAHDIACVEIEADDAEY